MQLTGELFIGGTRRGSSETYRAYHPRAGVEDAAIDFAVSTAGDVADACNAAKSVAADYAARPLEERARFLEAIAEEIETIGEQLTETAGLESGLPSARLAGERGRTTGQLRLFAAEVRSGAWQAVRIDHADADRVPRKPDLRLRMVPLGPVAIFGASNFPLAFSTAGGDTASALAAGCPVVVKAHPAHPGTTELVAGAIIRAAERTGMPLGVFNLVAGPSNAVGAALVADPAIAAVGFTGSRAGGEALMKLAAARPRPIPVYAEMSAVNPVVLMPAALEDRAEELADAYVASLAMGAGQFCTNPGILLALEGSALDRFTARARDVIAGQAAQVMLSAGIAARYAEGRGQLAGKTGVTALGEGLPPAGPNEGKAALFAVAGKDFLSDADHAQEIFGATSLVVACGTIDELASILAGMEGQLTATLHLDEADHGDAARLMPVIEQLSGRLVANGWPTGVEVTHAIVHGGPYPATSDGRSTSVGTLAIDRFLRPVSYQDWPEALLPEALRGEGVGAAVRRIDGRWQV